MSKKLYIVTAKGDAELTGAATSLTALELRLLVQVDGMANVEEITQRSTQKQSLEEIAALLEQLARKGYIADPDATAAINVGDFFRDAEAGLSSLQANGFYVRIARRGAPRSKEQMAQKVTVLAVEDDPQLAKLLRTYFQMEGFAVRLAAKREEINKALREEPKPDVVLLDVELPDSDGFDLLERMRGHPFMKDMPIIMATAKASREAVLTGLRRGADGYVTKPFDMAILLKAVRSVVGLPT